MRLHERHLIMLKQKGVELIDVIELESALHERKFYWPGHHYRIDEQEYIIKNFLLGANSLCNMILAMESGDHYYIRGTLLESRDNYGQLGTIELMRKDCAKQQQKILDIVDMKIEVSAAGGIPKMLVLPGSTISVRGGN